MIAVGCLVVSLLVGVPAAYSIARHRTGGDNLSFTILSFRFMPAIVPVVALFLIANKLKIFDTYFLLIITNCMAIIPFVIWIMKGFFDEIPYQIEEAAMVDGASWPRLFKDHLLPLAAPGLVAVGLFAFIFAWNELLVCDDPDWAPSYALHQDRPGHQHRPCRAALGRHRRHRSAGDHPDRDRELVPAEVHRAGPELRRDSE